MSVSREELRDSARKAFGAQGVFADAEASWALLSEMGWFMMTVPEAHGGLGLGGEAVAAIHIELGRALVPGGAISQMLAIEALCFADDFGGRDDLLAAAMAGERIALSLEAFGKAGGLDSAVDADRAARILLVEPDRIALAGIEAASPRPTWDDTRRLFNVVPGAAQPIATGEAAHVIAERIERRLLLALAADSIGGAEAVLEMSVEYLKTRRQFDRPLALFQALKHRIADMKTWAVAAEALLWSRTGEQVPLVALGALKALAADTYCRIAEEAIQLHGGIGLTAEHPCHLFMKRAFLNAALGGDADYWNGQAGRAALRGDFPAQHATGRS